MRENSSKLLKEQGGGYWLAVFMNGPIMSHQERGGHENMRGDKR